MRKKRRPVSRLREVEVWWEMFNFHVWVVVGPIDDLEPYARWRLGREINIDTEMEGCYIDAVPKRGGVLWLPHMPRSAADYGVLAHEVSHAVMDMLFSRRVKVERKHQETFAYAISHGVESILKELR